MLKIETVNSYSHYNMRETRKITAESFIVAKIKKKMAHFAEVTVKAKLGKACKYCTTKSS